MERLELQLKTAISGLQFYWDAEPIVAKRDDGNRAKLAFQQIDQIEHRRDKRKRPRSFVMEDAVAPLIRRLDIAREALNFYVSLIPSERREDAGPSRTPGP